MVGIKRGRDGITITGNTLEEIQKQLDLLTEQGKRTESENLDESSAEGTGTTNETNTSREVVTVSTTNTSTTTPDENNTNDDVLEDASAEAENVAVKLTPQERLTQLEHIKTLYIDNKNEVLENLNARRAKKQPDGSSYKQTNARYRKHYKDLTEDMKQEYRLALFDMETNDDRATANYLARMYSIIRKHQKLIDELKVEIERDGRRQTQRNLAILRNEDNKDNFSTSSLYDDISSANDEDEITFVSNLTEEEWGTINIDYKEMYQTNPPENPFAPDFRPDDFLTEIKVAAFQRELKKDLKKRFGMDLREYNIIQRNRRDEIQRAAIQAAEDAYEEASINNERLISDASSPPASPKTIDEVSVVTIERPTQRPRVN